MKTAAEIYFYVFVLCVFLICTFAANTRYENIEKSCTCTLPLAATAANGYSFVHDRLFIMQDKIVGIYKITSPSKKVYIGQSIDIHKRWKTYKNLHCKFQIKLLHSFQKYGVRKHKFEILQICEPEKLNELEIYYIELYQCFNSEYGLNLKTGGIGSPMKNRHHSEITKEKMKKSHIGINTWSKGLKKPQQLKDKLAIYMSGNKYMKGKFGSLHNTSKKVIDIKTGIIYETVTDAALKNCIKISTLSMMLHGHNKNKTNLTYYEI